MINIEHTTSGSNEEDLVLEMENALTHIALQCTVNARIVVDLRAPIPRYGSGSTTTSYKENAILFKLRHEVSFI